MSDFSNIIEEINTNLPDNTTQAITAKKLRDTLIDLTDTIEDQQDNFEESAMAVIDEALQIVEDGVKFKTGQIVNDVSIINNTYAGSSNDALSAQLGQQTAVNVGKPDFREVKLENYTAYQGRILLGTDTSPRIGNRTTTSFNYIIVDVEGVTSVRFRGCTISNADSGWAFYDETNYDPETQEDNDGGFLINSTGYINFMQYDKAVDTPQIKDYIVDVPEGAKYMKINSKYYDGSVIFNNTFYCYLRYGKDISETLTNKVDNDNTLGIFKWKKNLLNPTEFVNGSFESPYTPGSTPSLRNANALLSNKLYMEDNETYTLSNVSVYKSGEEYYLLVFEFDENDVFLGYKRYLAEKTSDGTSSYGEIGKRTLTYKKSYSACAYQRIRVRYAVLPTNPTFENWKTAQVEIGNQQTEYAPYHSEMYFPPLTTTMAAEGENLGNCTYNTIHNLEAGENVEDYISTGSTRWELIKYDASGSEAVYVSGEYGKGYYTLYPYLWADADGNKIENVTTVYTTSTRNSWSNARLYVPDGAKYLYLIAFGTKLNTYKFDKVINYDGLSLPDYIEDVLNTNNEELKESMKKTVNILAIGNSYTQDSLMYVPFLMQNFDVKVNMTILMKSSSTIKEAYDAFVDEDDIYEYQYYRAGTDDRWHTLGRSRLMTIQKALQYNLTYDIILMNVSYGWQPDGSLYYYNQLTSMITDYLDYPVKFACLQVLIHRSAVNTHNVPDMPSLWDPEKQYALQDFVLYEDKIYWALASNKNIRPTNTTYWSQFYKNWSETTRYSAGAIVYDGDTLYVSNDDGNIGNKPSSGVPTYWHYYEWDSRYTYKLLDLCMYRGRVYVSRVDRNIGNDPSESPDQWMFYNRPYTTDQFASYQNQQIDSCELVMDDSLCEDIIPVNAAIKNAYTVDAIKSIGAYKDNISNTTGYGWLLADDGFHLQEGLPCQLSAYAVCVWLLKKIGMDYKSILGDNTMATPEWLSTKYIQGQQGLPCGYDSTDEENNRRLKFIQKCAVMANKFPYEVKDMNTFYNV